MPFFGPNFVQLYRLHELSEDEREVVLAAIRARGNSQSPYSNFRVGAAVQSVRGDIHVGCNVERCSYTQTTHAEQCAIDNMVASEGSVGIRTLACYGAPKGVEYQPYDGRDVIDQMAVEIIQATVKPCGHCRQIIWENCLGNGHVKIFCVCPNGLIMAASIATLLPFPFGPTDLGIDYSKL